MFMASCGTLGVKDFARARYTKFGHNEPTVMFNKINHHAAEKIAHAPKINKTEPVTISPVSVPAQNIVAAQPEHIAKQPKVQAMVMNSKPAENKIKEANESNIAPSITSERIDNNTSTKDDGGSGVDPIVLIILAILLSPLAVYLYKNAVGTPFWIDLICWLLGVGVGIGVSFFGGLLWLFAVIYAILIVTGSVSA